MSLPSHVARRRIPWILCLTGLVVLLMTASPQQAFAADLWTNASIRGLLLSMEKADRGAVDLSMSLGIAPWPQLVLGAEAGVLFPFGGGGDAAKGVVLQAAPACWWRFGSPETWGYVKLGSGMATQKADSGWARAWILTGAAGFAVAPRELTIFFGFEIGGEIELLGMPIRTIGLGGMVGAVF